MAAALCTQKAGVRSVKCAGVVPRGCHQSAARELTRTRRAGLWMASSHARECAYRPTLSGLARTLRIVKPDVGKQFRQPCLAWKGKREHSSWPSKQHATWPGFSWVVDGAARLERQLSCSACTGSCLSWVRLTALAPGVALFDARRRMRLGLKQGPQHVSEPHAYGPESDET